MAEPYTASPERSQNTQSQRSVQAPYFWGTSLSVLFLVQAVPNMSSFVILHIIFIIVSFSVILIVPGAFVVGLLIPTNIVVSPLGLFGLSSIASLFVSLTVGYVLSSYRLLDAHWLFLGVGSISVILVLATWRVRGPNFWLCKLKTKRPQQWIMRPTWSSLTMIVVTLTLFVLAVVTSVQSDYRVYPSVYLANRQGHLSGYPMQLQRGQTEVVVLHVDNAGGRDGAYTVKERDNGRILWSLRTVVAGNKAWAHPLRLPTTALGLNRVHVLVVQRGRLIANLHITYRVRG
ncbi:MAG: hypothetical protein C7B45_01305 [Sulfobacillus acidophilus]|uniref:DUF1616 domain-containing protein n=1 Tax=Sulfobacillus acidophilus TaxID=53633 RepID=A0A2T2WNY3_9FIRM|nr:MAG: hypothetical protein C7B45_01305 [Sulfobacillus acidophilus]